MANEPETRDLLAERIRRLEKQVAESNQRLVETGQKLDRAALQLDTLVDLVGRLGRVVDVQGETLHDDENQLEEKVGAIELRISDLTSGLRAVMSRLEAIGAEITTSLVKLRED